MNIVLYKEQSQYGVVRFFIDEMAIALKKMGHNVAVIDLLKDNWMDNLNQTLNNYNGCDFIFAFNGIGIDLLTDNRSLYDVINVPFVTSLIDHPCHYISRLNTKINQLIVTCADKSHLEFLTNCYPQDHIQVKAFVSHVGSLVSPFSHENFEIYLKNRTIPLLFAGSFIPPERLWVNFPHEIARLLDDVTDCVLGYDCIALEEACDYVLSYRNMELSMELKKKFYSMLLPFADKYIQAYCRHRCLETIAEAEIPMVICSNGWDNYLPEVKCKSVTFIGTRNYRELLNGLQQAKLFLNTATNMPYGANDQVFNAMLNGAVIVNQENRSPEFVDGQNSVLYKWTRLGSLPQKISELLENPETAFRIAKTAIKKAEKEYTWMKRAQEILRIVELHKNLYNLTIKI